MAVSSDAVLRVFAVTCAFLFALGAVMTSLWLSHVPQKPDIDTDKWWGVGSKPDGAMDQSIRKFKIEFNDTVIQALRSRIRERRPLTKPLEGVQSEYGMNTDYLEKILEHWQGTYDFGKRAEFLNRFDHYKTKIQGLDIHFIRAKPAQRNFQGTVLPLLLLHGWPSSSKEFDKIIPMLTTPRKGYGFVFEVVAADLPGFGFSEGTTKPGLNPVQIGVIMRNLMLRLGFQQFYVHAGDWGAQCAVHMATLFPEHVLGLHTNMPLSSMLVSQLKTILGAFYPSFLVDSKYLDRIYPLKNFFAYLIRESGYFHIQATKPDTIGVALTDSPSGLASYIMEKMAICTNRDQLNTPHGGLEGLDIEDVLDTVTIAWVNSCIVTSMRIYAEGYSTKSSEINILHEIPTIVPTAVINFRYEVVYQPDWILRDKFPNLVHSTTLDFGGHFAALEYPNELADDIYEGTEEFLKFHTLK